MPDSATVERARKDRQEGKSASPQAGEFVQEEFHHIREGKHGARSPQQAIAIGLSKARRAGVPLPPPARGRSTAKVRRQAERDVEHGAHAHSTPSRSRSRTVVHALQREGHSAASSGAISRQAQSAARRHTVAQRSASARAAVRTKGHAGLVAAGREAAHTRRLRH